MTSGASVFPVVNDQKVSPAEGHPLGRLRQRGTEQVCEQRSNAAGAPGSPLVHQVFSKSTGDENSGEHLDLCPWELVNVQSSGLHGLPQ